MCSAAHCCHAAASLPKAYVPSVVTLYMRIILTGRCKQRTCGHRRADSGHGSARRPLKDACACILANWRRPPAAAPKCRAGDRNTLRDRPRSTNRLALTTFPTPISGARVRLAHTSRCRGSGCAKPSSCALPFTHPFWFLPTRPSVADRVDVSPAPSKADRFSCLPQRSTAVHVLPNVSQTRTRTADCPRSHNHRKAARLPQPCCPACLGHF